jgi:peptide/nickel transport system permease protein
VVAVPASSRDRSGSRLLWSRFRRDRLAVASGVFLALLIAAIVVGPPIAERVLGHGPNDLFPYAVDTYLKPVGPLSRVPDLNTSVSNDEYDLGTAPPGTPKTLLILGGDGPLGRDMFERLLVGGRISLEVAFGASLLAVLIGLVLGGLAGFLGGMVDGAIGRLTDFIMAFPLLLLLILLGNTVGNRITFVTLHGALQPGVFSLILLIGIFAWFYPARIVRAEVSALKQREFVESARMVGAGEWRILRTHIFPHVMPVLLAYSSFLVASVILIEAGLSFLNVGIRLPTASWGTLLTNAWGTYRNPQPYDPQRMSIWVTVFPTLAILVTAVAWTLFGEGLRRALAPRSR